MRKSARLDDLMSERENLIVKHRRELGDKEDMARAEVEKLVGKDAIDDMFTARMHVSDATQQLKMTPEWKILQECKADQKAIRLNVAQSMNVAPWSANRILRTLFNL